jgi:hypothetical protein
VASGERVRIPLREIAFARSGDKGDTSNVGVVPYDEADFDRVREQVTVARVRELFAPLVQGEITCYEFPGIKALNFVMTHALGGGVSRTLNMDLHGKTYASLMLRLEIEVDAERAARIPARR